MRPNAWRMLATIGLLAGALAGKTIGERRRPDVLAQPLSSIRTWIDGWASVDNAALAPEVLRTLGATNYVSRTYFKSNLAMDVFVAYYAQQRASEEMHSPKHCLPGSGWEIMQMGGTTIRPAGQPITVNEDEIQNMGKRAVVLYWYQSKQRIVASEYLGKLLLIKDSLLNAKTSASIARIVVPDQPAAIEAGRDFASKLALELQRCFGR